MQKKEGRRRRDRLTQQSGNHGTHLAAGSRWLGAQVVAAVAALASGGGAVEVAGTRAERWLCCLPAPAAAFIPAALGAGVVLEL